MAAEGRLSPAVAWRGGGKEAAMQLGACFPSNEVANDPAAIRDWAAAVEDLGYDVIEVFEHVLSSDPDDSRRSGARYDSTTIWHEPLVLLSFFAALTSRVELLTGILILPQRQTVLVAKQVAEIDIISGGRMHLGIGTGWSEVEYRALGQDFHTRGRRSEEQIGLLRRLWAEPTLDYAGEFDEVPRAGLNPRPGRLIPIWLGGRAPIVLDRVGRLGDGWVAGWVRPNALAEQIGRIHAAAGAAGRDPSAIRVETRTLVSRLTPEQQAEHARAAEEAGATLFSLHTGEAGYTSMQQHIDALRAFRETLGS